MTSQPDDDKTVEHVKSDGTVPEAPQEVPATIDEITQPEDSRNQAFRVVEKPAELTADADIQETIHEQKPGSEVSEWLDQKSLTQKSPGNADRTLEKSSESRPRSGSITDNQTGKAAPGITSPGKALRGRETSLPEHIAGYETLDRLGEGSFGIVLKCRDVKLDRAVAIKLQKLNPLKSRGKIDRFLSEARAAGQLRHPHIVPVYEFGEFGGNQFIVYEFVDGETLDNWIKANKDVRTRVELMAKIADALDYAHSLGIIHRDIKPANILIDREHDQPHVADFGCAKLENVDVMQTVDGSMMGTPAYMSPEVCDGFANQADGRADLWAVGVMMYEMLVGERPFGGKYGELFQQIRTVDPKRLRQIDNSIPEELETITLKCMEKDKDRRYQTCGALAEDLRNWLHDRPISARKVGVLERTWLWSKRNPTVATLLGIVVGCLMLIAIGSTLYSINIVNKQNALVKSHLDSLESAAPSELPTIVEDLARLDPASVDRVRNELMSQKRGPRESFPFNLALYQLGKKSGNPDTDALKGLADYVPLGQPERHETLLKIVDAEDLSLHNADFWAIARDSTRSSGQRILASAILASTDPANPAWKDQIAPTIAHLLWEEPAMVPRWAKLLRPVATHLGPEITRFFASDESASNDANEMQRVAEIAGVLYEDDPSFLVGLGLGAKPQQLRAFRPALTRVSAQAVEDNVEDVGALTFQERANLRLMQAYTRSPSSRDLVLPELSLETPPDVRYRLISYCGAANVDKDALADWISSAANRESSAMQGAILALGGYNLQQLFQTDRERLKPVLLKLFCEHPDAGVHSACRWLLGSWGYQDDISGGQKSIQSKQPKPGFSWHEDETGVCFAVFDRGPDHLRFGIAVYETTRQEFERVENQMVSLLGKQAKQVWKDRADALKSSQDDRFASEKKDPAKDVDDAPVTYISWDHAAFYCNAMNVEAKIKEQDVYSFEKDSLWRFVIKNNALQKLGHRLPTAQEWEYACRGSSKGQYFFGNSIDLYEDYLWSVNNSYDNRKPVGLKKPNENGLFDVQGNADEWCHNKFDQDNDMDRAKREIRGQGVNEEVSDIAISRRDSEFPQQRRKRGGLRLARTYRPVNDPD